MHLYAKVNTYCVELHCIAWRKSEEETLEDVGENKSLLQRSVCVSYNIPGRRGVYKVGSRY